MRKSPAGSYQSSSSMYQLGRVLMPMVALAVVAQASSQIKELVYPKPPADSVVQRVAAVSEYIDARIPPKNTAELAQNELLLLQLEVFFHRALQERGEGGVLLAVPHHDADDGDTTPPEEAGKKKVLTFATYPDQERQAYINILQGLDVLIEEAGVKPHPELLRKVRQRLEQPPVQKLSPEPQ